jgi:hypothetical protein
MKLCGPSRHKTTDHTLLGHPPQRFNSWAQSLYPSSLGTLGAERTTKKPWTAVRRRIYSFEFTVSHLDATGSMELHGYMRWISRILVGCWKPKGKMKQERPLLCSSTSWRTINRRTHSRHFTSFNSSVFEKV